MRVSLFPGLTTGGFSMSRTATVAFVAALMVSSSALACSGWKSAESDRPVTTAQVDTSGQSTAPWAQGNETN